MLWVRRFSSFILSLVLLGSISAAVTAFSVTSTLTKPQKVETLLNQSPLYDQIVATVTSQVQKAIQNSDQLGAISLDNATVKQAVSTALSRQIVQQSTDAIIEGNYAWLQGKTAKPIFTVDLTGPKADFAQQIGEAVRVHLSSLPVCTANQITQLGNLDLLKIPCQPMGLSPQTEGTQIQQALTSSQDFLAHPVFTADTLNPDKPSNSSSTPYYQRLHWLPKAYQLIVNLPYILGAVALVSAVGLVFVARTRRLGLRLVAKLLAVAGILLIATKLLSDYILQKLLKQTLTAATDKQVHQAVSDFAHQLEADLTRINIVAGIGLLVIALIITIALLATRQRKSKKIPSNIPSIDGPLAKSSDLTTNPSKPNNTTPQTLPMQPAAPTPRPTQPTAPLLPTTPATPPKAKPLAKKNSPNLGRRGLIQ